FLRQPRHAEMVADLVEGGDEAPRPDGVADARARHTMRLRKGADADNTRVFGIDRRQRARGREIAIGLVENEKAAGGKFFENRKLVVGRKPASGRIVGIGEIDEPRIAGLSGIGKRFWVVAEGAIGRGDEPAAESVHMKG